MGGGSQSIGTTTGVHANRGPVGTDSPARRMAFTALTAGIDMFSTVGPAVAQPMSGALSAPSDAATITIAAGVASAMLAGACLLWLQKTGSAPSFRPLGTLDRTLTCSVMMEQLALRLRALGGTTERSNLIRVHLTDEYGTLLILLQRVQALADTFDVDLLTEEESLAFFRARDTLKEMTESLGASCSNSIECDGTTLIQELRRADALLAAAEQAYIREMKARLQQTRITATACRALMYATSSHAAAVKAAMALFDQTLNDAFSAVWLRLDESPHDTRAQIAEAWLTGLPHLRDLQGAYQGACDALFFLLEGKHISQDAFAKTRGQLERLYSSFTIEATAVLRACSAGKIPETFPPPIEPAITSCENIGALIHVVQEVERLHTCVKRTHFANQPQRNEQIDRVQRELQHLCAELGVVEVFVSGSRAAHLRDAVLQLASSTNRPSTISGQVEHNLVTRKIASLRDYRRRAPLGERVRATITLWHLGLVQRKLRNAGFSGRQVPPG